MENQETKELTVYEALALAQAEFEPVIFDKKGAFNSKYASLASIRKSTQPALSKYGITHIQPWAHLENGDIILSTILHKSGLAIISTCLVSRGTKSDQDFGKSVTYMRRYQLSSLLGIFAEEEDDGETDRKNKLEEERIERVKAVKALLKLVTPEEKACFWTKAGCEYPDDINPAKLEGSVRFLTGLVNAVKQPKEILNEKN